MWWKHGAVRVALSWGLALAYLWISGPGVPVQEDSIHDYSLARRCAEGEGCLAHNTSMIGISQGRLLLMLMAGAMRLGVHPQLQHVVMMAITAIAIVMLAELARSLAGGYAGLMAGVVAAWLLPMAADHPTLWNPTLASFPLALLTVGLVQLARTGLLRWVVAIVIGIVGAYHGHVVHLITWPIAVVVVGAITNRWDARVIALLGPALGLLVFDTQTSVALLFGSWFGWVVLAAAVGGVVIGMWLRPGFVARPQDQQPRIVLAGLGGAVLVLVGVGAVLADLPIEGRYFAAAFPALAVLFGVSLESTRARLRPVVFVVTILFVTSRLHLGLDLARMWAFGDVDRLDDALREHTGAPLAAYGCSIRAPYGQDLVNAARVLDVELPACVGDGTALEILPVPRGACTDLGAGWQCVELDWRLSAAWSIDRAPWIDPGQFEACSRSFAQPDRESCIAVDVDDPRYSRAPGYPRVIEDERLSADGPVETWAQRLVVTAGDGGERWVVLARDWTLRDARGVDVEIGPSMWGRTSLRIRAEPGTRGVLTIEQFADGALVAPATPAIIAELGPEDQALVEAVLGVK